MIENNGSGIITGITAAIVSAAVGLVAAIVGLAFKRVISEAVRRENERYWKDIREDMDKLGLLQGKTFMELRTACSSNNDLVHGAMERLDRIEKKRRRPHPPPTEYR